MVTNEYYEKVLNDYCTAVDRAHDSLPELAQGLYGNLCLVYGEILNTSEYKEKIKSIEDTAGDIIAKLFTAINYISLNTKKNE